MNFDKRKLTDLVEENYVYSSVLYYFGVDFYNYSELTFNEACSNHGLKPEVVISTLEALNKHEVEQDLYLVPLPVDLIIAYLKHKHYLFIKQTLPYLAKLVDHYPVSANSEVITDLKLIFPVFVEDCIHHMFEKEDKIFKYISALDRAVTGRYNISQLYLAMETHSIAAYAADHKAAYNVMSGIKTLTSKYAVSAKSTILQNVIYAELQAFENKLIIHSQVENDVLYPKALLLENQVKKHFQELIKLN